MILCLLILLRQCGVNRDIDRAEKNIKSIQQKVDSLPSQSQVEYTMNKVMFDFLIYEDDFDKGKTSLSDIKQKINSAKNEK